MVVIFLIIFVFPILPSLILTLLSEWAFRRNRRFWYYNLSFASFGNGLFLIWFLLWFFYSPRRLDAQEGLVLLSLPVLGLIFSAGSFLLSVLLYPGLNGTDSSDKENPFPSYPFWMSVGSMIGFGLTWLLSVFVKPFQFH
ncbi:MAG: hypothetical protein M3384_14360 [Acidobacteriota bacterium]|nr:hypothetical protein [Acidobacteriota bacterium]